LPAWEQRGKPRRTSVQRVLRTGTHSDRNSSGIWKLRKSLAPLWDIPSPTDLDAKPETHADTGHEASRADVLWICMAPLGQLALPPTLRDTSSEAWIQTLTRATPSPHNKCKSTAQMMVAEVPNLRSRAWSSRSQNDAITQMLWLLALSPLKSHGQHC